MRSRILLNAFIALAAASAAALAQTANEVVEKTGEPAGAVTEEAKNDGAARDKARGDRTGRIVRRIVPKSVSEPAGKVLGAVKSGASAAVKAKIDIAEAANKQLKVPFDAQVKAAESAAKGRPLSEIGADLDRSRLKYQSIFGDEIVAQKRSENVPIDTGTDVFEIVVGSAAGEDGKQLAQPITVPLRLATALNLSASQYADYVIKGEDPAMVVAIPLATLLDQAVASLRSRAKPMPEQWRVYLSAHYSTTLLQSARYVIDDDFDITLPNGINVVARGTAVTLNGITVFPREPNFDDVRDRHWWAHETKHLVQYQMFGGTLPFAYQYLKHCPTLERDADRAADQTLLENHESETVAPSGHCKI